MKVVCLLGMHRSGTSLMASYLQHCGISMGQRMVQAGVGNPKGHFEDKDFVEFHKAVLRRNGSYMYAPKPLLDVDDEHRQKAREMVHQRRAAGSDWGFKDPRGALFLDFWGELLPEARYFFVYRDPYLVIDSLFRRKGDWPLYLMFGWAASAWIRYNNEILAFFKKNPQKCVLVNIGGFNRNPEEARAAVAAALDLNLHKPYSDVYAPKYITSDSARPTGFYTRLCEMFYRGRLDALYAELEANALVDASGRCAQRVD